MKSEKKKTKFIILFICILVVAAGTAAFYLYRENAAAAQSSVDEAVAGENQTLLTVSVEKMIGNEMTGVQSTDKEQGEEQTWTIPVGTEVVTKLGTTTTFARLAAGDTVEVLIDDQTQEILKIWITQ